MRDFEVLRGDAFSWMASSSGFPLKFCLSASLKRSHMQEVAVWLFSMTQVSESGAKNNSVENMKHLFMTIQTHANL